jgi:hypothetical protein
MPAVGEVAPRVNDVGCSPFVRSMLLLLTRPARSAQAAVPAHTSSDSARRNDGKLQGLDTSDIKGDLLKARIERKFSDLERRQSISAQ